MEPSWASPIKLIGPVIGVAARSILQKAAVLPLLMASFSAAALPINPVSVVFRVDDRPMADIKEAGGMRPWADGIPDDDLTHHFEGESVEGHTSNFVSTTSSIRAAVEHAASLARPNSEEPFDSDFVTYIYQVRPDEGFFDVEASLARARDAAPTDSQRRSRLDRIIRDYTGMEELVARRGFSHDRIIAYAALTGEMLQRWGVASNSPLFSAAFWSGRWTRNADYNASHDSDRSNADVYGNVGDPEGSRSMVTNGTQPAVPVAFTCLGIQPGPSSSQRQGRGAAQASCSSHAYMNTSKVFYDKGLLISLLLDD